MSSDPLANPWFQWAFLGVGLLLMALGVHDLLRHRHRKRDWVPRDGIIIGTRLDDGLIRVQVAFEQDGREVRFWNRNTSSGSRFVGQPVKILANPADPADAVVAGGSIGGGVVGIAFLVMGLVSAGVGAAMAGWI